MSTIAGTSYYRTGTEERQTNSPSPPSRTMGPKRVGDNDSTSTTQGGDDKELEPLQPESVSEVVVLNIPAAIPDAKLKELVGALEACEGVQEVEAQSGCIVVTGTAPADELVGVAKGLGVEADGRKERRVSMAVYETKAKQAEDKTLFFIKAGALITLSLQNAGQALCLKYSNEPSVVDANGHKYISSTAVCMGEVFKVMAAIAILIFTKGGLGGFVQEVNVEMVQKPVECAKLLIPSLLYTVQNNLQFIALANISAALYQVTAQLKILTTALFTVILLSRSLGPHRWGALTVLTAGCIFVNLDAMGPKTGGSGEHSIANQIFGVLCTLAGACTSGLAGVYFEKMLKGAKTSLWIRQIQLGGGGIFFAVFGAYYSDGSKIAEHGFFQGYTAFIWLVVCINAFGGLVVAVVVKYTDNIAKAFAVSISIIIASVISVPLFGFSLSYLFMIGTFLVIGSVFLYEAIINFDLKVNSLLGVLVIAALAMVKL